MMIHDDGGQVALEYLLIFAVSLILLVVFTLPLVEQSVENTVDVSDSVEMKSDLSNLAQVITQVHGEGQGSKHSTHITSSSNINLNVAGGYVSANMKLKDGSTKLIKVNHKSNLGKTSLKLKKGENTIIVEWPVKSENMIIYQ